MRTGAELIVLAGILHLAALGVAGALVLLMLRSDTTMALPPPEPDEDGGADGGGDGGGGGGLEPHPPRRGPRLDGPPLPSSRPARVRLRGPARLAELLPRRSRRPAREPGLPRRVRLRR